MKKYLIIVIAILSLGAFFNAQAVDITLRFGQGGFRDARAPDGILGGGQIALDVKLGELPIAISTTLEYYTKDPVADSIYEMSGIIFVNALYLVPRTHERVDIFLGGGIGKVDVPRGAAYPDVMLMGIMYDLVAGINIEAFWKIGCYGVGKYIYSSREIDNIQVIDISNLVALVGISLNFNL